MSINVDGNKITKFGKNLPTPYFDEIEIQDTRIKISYSYYFQKPQEIDDDTFTEYVDGILDQLKTAAIFMPKYTTSEDTPEFSPNTHISSKFFINGKFDVKEALYEDPSKIYDLYRLCHMLNVTGVSRIAMGPRKFAIPKTTSNTGWHGLFKQHGTYYSKFETLYDSTGTEVRRYLYQMNVRINNETSEEVYSLIQSVTNIPELEIDLFLSSTSLTISDTDTLDTLFISPESVYFQPLYTKQISDINCETIASKGTFKSTPERVYRFKSTGNVYSDGDVLQGLDALYYAVSDSVRSDLISNVRRVIQTGYRLPSGQSVSVSVNPAVVSNEFDDSDLNDARNNVSYVLEVFGSSPNLLVKLNEAASAFPTTSTATSAGRMHERLEIAIFNGNNAIKNNGSEIIKQINVNTYVNDTRDSPTYVVNNRYNSTAYTNRIKLNEKNEYIYTDAFRYGCYLDPNEYENTVLIPAQLYSYSINGVTINPDGIREFVGTRTHSELEQARNIILNWFMEHMRIGKPQGTGFQPPASDYGKILLYFGSPGDQLETLPLIAAMAAPTLGYGEIPIELYNYVGGLSLTSKMDPTSTAPEDGWYFTTGTWSSTGPSWTPSSTWAKNLAKNFEGYGAALMNDTRFDSDTNIRGLSFAGPNIIFIKTWAIAFNIINAYLEVTEHQLVSYNSYLAGYWWFDYEKAMKERSLLSFVYSASKIDNFFGPELLNGFFKVKETNIERLVYKNVDDKIMKDVVEQDSVILSDLPDDIIKVGNLRSIISTSGYINTSNTVEGGNHIDTGIIYNTEEGVPYLPLDMVSYITQPNTDSDPAEGEAQTTIGTLGLDIVDNDPIEYTYNVMRNFKPLNDPETENYRLMCFEHQEVAGPFSNDTIYDETEFPYSALVHSVQVEDTTARVVYKIAKVYRDYMKGDFNNYYESAIEQCSYNSNDHTFNDFFKTNAKNEFSQNMNEAPWYKMPVMYHFHLDLLYDTYGGSHDAIFSAAILDAEKIAPDTGTFEQLFYFNEKVNNLFENEYNSIGPESSVLYRIGIATPGGSTIETFNDLEDYPSVTIHFNTNRFGTSNNIAFTNIPPAINLVNTLQYDPVNVVNVYDYNEKNTEDHLKLFSKAVAELTAFWNSGGDGDSYRTFPPPYNNLYKESHTTSGCSTLRMNAPEIAKKIWDKITVFPGANDYGFGNFDVATDGQINEFLTYKGYLTAYDASIEGSIGTKQNKMIDLRDKIQLDLMQEFYVGESGSTYGHPLWVIERSELPMVEFFDAINLTIEMAMNLIASMAGSTYSFFTQGKNPSGFTVQNARDMPIQIGSDDSSYEQTAGDYIKMELENYFFEDC